MCCSVLQCVAVCCSVQYKPDDVAATRIHVKYIYRINLQYICRIHVKYIYKIHLKYICKIHLKCIYRINYLRYFKVLISNTSR